MPVYCDYSWSILNSGVINFHLVSDVHGAELIKMIHWLVFSVFGMNAGGNPQQCYLGLWWKIPRRLRLPALHYAPCNFSDYIQREKERQKESRREGEIPSTKIRNTSVTMCVKLDHFAWMAAESSMYAVFFWTTTTCCSSSCFFSHWNASRQDFFSLLCK